MARRRAALFAVCLALWFAAPAPARGEGDASPDLSLLYRRKNVLVHTKQDLWYSGKAYATYEDSLVFKQESDSVRVAGADIVGAWRTGPAPLRNALIRGAEGFVGGAALEFMLGGECADCAPRASRMLKSAAIGGGLDLVSSALFGLFGGGWKQLVPAGGTDEPFPVWGGSAGLDWASPPLTGSHKRILQGRIASWSFGSPQGSAGVEYGTIASTSGAEDLVGTTRLDSLSGPTPVFTHHVWRSRVAYVTSQFRRRSRGTSARSSITVGFGSYFERDGDTAVLRDSTGTIVRTFRGSSTQRHIGANVGGGVTFGRGRLRPGIEGRVHWISGGDRLWVTLGLVTDWR
jgi:hypothetical protein